MFYKGVNYNIPNFWLSILVQTITVGRRGADAGRDANAASVRIDTFLLCCSILLNKHIDQVLLPTQFKFDGVLHNATQDAVYEACGVEAIESVLQGYNATILAYGQTGAGKTYTMSGGRDSYKQRGLVPRCISALFGEFASKSQTAAVIRVRSQQCRSKRLQRSMLHLMMQQ